MKGSERFKFLLGRYLEGNLSFREQDEFFGIVETGEYDGMLGEHLEESLNASSSNGEGDLPGDISRKIYEAIINSDKKKSLPGFKKYRHYFFLVAAVFLGIIVTSALFYFYNANGTERFKSEFVKMNTDRYINNENVAVTFLLPDGSLITLQPKSSLSYCKKSFNSKREVYMEGDGMFQVAKDPNRPFLVYYQDVVTKVLGTCFNIHTNPTSGNIEVEVLSGRVQVFENGKIHRVEIKNYCILTPNQKVIYKGEERAFKTTLVEAPKIIISDTANAIKENVNLFNFENAPLSDVFKSIETSYKIEITVSNQSIYNCVFSGDLSEHDLFTKLKVICLAASLKYEVVGTTILLTGDGCNQP